MKRGKYKPESRKFPIKCFLCSKDYLGKRKNVKFCSKLCIQRYNSLKKPKKISKGITTTKVCKNCDLKFSFTEYPTSKASGHKGIFCKNSCFVEYSKKHSFNFPCAICKKPIFTQPTQLKYRSRTTCSLLCRATLARLKAEKRRVELGYTKHQLDRLARYSPEMQIWRQAVFSRDNWTCQVCNIRGCYLEADHIKPFAYFPELRTSMENGRTLCRTCHDKTKISAKKMKELYEKN